MFPFRPKVPKTAQVANRTYNSKTTTTTVKWQPTKSVTWAKSKSQSLPLKGLWRKIRARKKMTKFWWLKNKKALISLPTSTNSLITNGIKKWTKKTFPDKASWLCKLIPPPLMMRIPPSFKEGSRRWMPKILALKSLQCIGLRSRFQW